MFKLLETTIAYQILRSLILVFRLLMSLKLKKEVSSLNNKIQTLREIKPLIQ